MNDLQRDHAIDRLSSAFAQGRLEVDELERRLALVQSAQTQGELDALGTDLAPASVALVPAQRVRVVLSSVERRGPWVVPAQLTARVLLGNAVFDLRDASLGPGGTTIDVNVTMGHLEVIVPPGVDVQVEASPFLANIEQRTERATTPGPIVRIVGRVKLGNLELSTLRRGETHRDARRRRRIERRAHRRWRRELPSSLDW
jgi:hypothetical protein